MYIIGRQDRSDHAAGPRVVLNSPGLQKLLSNTWLTRLARGLRAALAWLALLIPFGLLVRTKPRHYREMLRVAWENRGRWRYALRILRHGVCDGCSLGPRGLRDDVIPGVHLCLTRLGLLRLNTMGPIPDDALASVERLRALSNEELHRLGRVPA